MRENGVESRGPEKGVPNTGTGVYCVIGDPVGHSLSPIMHNRAFSETGYNGIFSAFRVTDLSAAVAGIRGLGIRGVSVTIPHKQKVMALLDDIDDAARRIGAVNTIVNRNGRLFGYNTDCRGAMTALAEKTTVAHKKVWVLGAGGAARAIGFGVRDEGGTVTLINRTREKGALLAAELDAEFIPLSDVHRIECDILINATSVGMAPDTAATPIPLQITGSGVVVMDVVYNPLKTQLLKVAESRGCPTVDGVGMFVHQGAAQFELWTGLKAPVDLMRRTVIEKLREKR